MIIGTVLLLRPSFVSATDPEDKLQCDSDKRVTTSVTHDENVVETKQPNELAASWRDGTAGARTTALTEQKVFNASKTKTKIGYTDGKGRMFAVLVYEKRTNGWRLDSVIECATAITLSVAVATIASRLPRPPGRTQRPPLPDRVARLRPGQLWN
ncbi:MAG TPA: hypothetical protein VF062_11460 [Candidatus Limnocylindrales bacterium]